MKTVLITGANSGIGFATVKLFLESGYQVFAHYHSNNNNLKLIESNRLVLKKANLENLVETNELFEFVMQKTKSIDVLVNNAAIYSPLNTFDELNLENLDQALNINLKSPFLLMKCFIDLMKNFNRGKIINFSSIGVKYGGSINSIAYTTSKSALETLTLSFAKEGAKYNILVNALRVGVTNTEIHKLNKGKNMNTRIEMIPLQRMAEAEEIAEYVLFLASDKSNFTTGSIITIAGGE